MSRSRYVTCPDCDGSGFLDEDGNPTDPKGSGNHGDPVECETCGGRGETLEGSDA